jgi:hypothetical protein
LNRWISGEWVVDRTNAQQRRTIHYWATVIWLIAGLVIWIILRDALWFVGFMSLYAIWVTHLAGWAAETPVEHEGDSAVGASVEPAHEVSAAGDGATGDQSP